MNISFNAMKKYLERIIRLENDSMTQRRQIVNLSLKIIDYAKKNNESPEQVLAPILGAKLSKDFTEEWNRKETIVDFSR